MHERDGRVHAAAADGADPARLAAELWIRLEAASL
jgi:hypothetical protein